MPGRERSAFQQNFRPPMRRRAQRSASKTAVSSSEYAVLRTDTQLAPYDLVGSARNRIWPGFPIKTLRCPLENSHDLGDHHRCYLVVLCLLSAAAHGAALERRP